MRSFIARRRRESDEVRRAKLAQARADFRRIISMIVDRFAPIRIYQWGSLVEDGHFSELSDIDIAVEGVTDPRLFFEMVREAEKLTELPLDLLQIEHVHPVYAEGIRRRGRVVYGRST